MEGYSVLLDITFTKFSSKLIHILLLMGIACSAILRVEQRLHISFSMCIILRSLASMYLLFKEISCKVHTRQLKIHVCVLTSRCLHIEV